MILASHANDASKAAPCRGVQVPRVQLGLRKLKRSPMSKFVRFIAENEELFYVGVAFGAGTIAAGILIALVSLF